jgi:DNA-binding NarL/FixJ family response regulator
VADADAASRTDTCRILRDGGHEPTEAASGEQALQAARSGSFSALVLEVSLPSICGYDVCRRVKDEYAEQISILLVSATRTESCDRVAGILLGADDYLCKPFAADEFLARIELLLRRSASPSNGSALTSRERQVLGLLEEGLRQREIAERLCISHKTVGTHLEHIFSKLGARNRLHAVSLAYRRGIIGHST